MKGTPGFRRTVVNMVSGGAGYVIPMALTIISTPYVLKMVGKEAYGLQVLANVVIGYLVVAEMGLDIPIIRRIAEYHARDEMSEKSQFLVATWKLYFLIGASGAVILLALVHPLVSWLAIPADLAGQATTVFYMSALGFLASIMNMWGKAVFNGVHRYDISNGITILNSVFGIALGIGLIHAGYGIIGFFGARVLGFFMSGVVYSILAKRYVFRIVLAPFIDRTVWNFLAKQIRYGFLLRLSGMLFARLDQILIGFWIGISSVTVYSIPILIVTSLTGLIASITQFSFSMFSALKATNDSAGLEKLFFRITRFVVAVSTLTYVPLIILGDKVIALWITPAIAFESHTVFVLLAISFYVNACLNISTNSFIVAVGELGYFTAYSIARGLCLLLGFILLIKPYGIEGAGIAYVCVLTVDTFFVLYTIGKKLGYHLGPLLMTAFLKPVLAGAVLGALLYFTQPGAMDWIQVILYFSAFGISYVGVAFVTGIIDKADRSLLRTILTRKSQS